MNNDEIVKRLIDDTKNYMIPPELDRQFIKILNKYTNDNSRKCRLNEAYVNWNFQESLRDMGYKYSCSPKPYTYRRTRDYKAGKKNGRGIDNRFTVIHDTPENRMNIVIEVKGWMKYRDINDYIFEKQVLKRFTDYDPQNTSYRFLAVNKRNVKLIQERCKANNIQILPLKNQITEPYLRMYHFQPNPPYYPNFSYLESFSRNRRNS